MRGRARFAFALIAIPAIATVVLSLPRVADGITAPLEQHALSAVPPERALPRTAVVLGGAVGIAGPGDRPDESGYDLFGAADRVVAAARLWHAGKVDRLVLSGGSAKGLSEAELMARFAGDLGVPRTALVLESDSRTTRQNAQATAAMLRSNGLGIEIALVTSALHLPRAMAEFRCAGLTPFAVPAEYASLGVAHEFPSAWLPSTGALDLSRRALKERLGALVGGC